MTNFSPKQAIQYLLYALLITPTIVVSSMLFPYISARTIYFRVIIEIIALIFIALIWKYNTQWRQQKNYFFIIFSLFVAANIISSFFSFSFSLAWFSDIERMWGVFTIIHLFLLYIFLRAFFQGEQWKIFLNISIIVSMYVAGYGIVQYYPQVFNITLFQAGPSRIISTLGNSAYVAIYLVFNIFFAAFLFLTNKHKVWRLLYAVAIIMDLFAFDLAGIRGTMLGVLAGLGVASLLYILLGESKKYKVALTVIIVTGASVLFFALQHPSNPLVKQNDILAKISSIDLGGTSQTRLIGWRAAWNGFKHHPVFGVGSDNYNVIFNKYFDANYYLIAPTEPYFDRSHNAWLDVLVMNGIVGFVIFLCFPIFIFYYLIQSWRKHNIPLSEFLLFTALSVAYFTHLLFVFDDLNSYTYFVVLLGFIEYRYYKEAWLEVGEQRENNNMASKGFLSVGVIIVLLAMYNFNIKVMQACIAVVDAMQYKDNMAQMIEGFDRATDYDIVPSRNIVTSYVNYLTQQGNNLMSIVNDPEQRQVFITGLDHLLKVMDKEINKDPDNAMLYNRRAVLYNLGFLVSNNPKYISASINDSQAAISLSHEHLQYYYTLADSYMIGGDTSKAIATIKESIDINNQYTEGYFNLMRIYLAVNDLDKALDTEKTLIMLNYHTGDGAVFISLAQKFYSNNEPDKELMALELAFQNYKRNSSLAAKLIQLYLSNNNNEKAIETARSFGDANPGLKNQTDYFISEIQEGRGAMLLKEMSSN